MPELPEVEVTRISIERPLSGALVKSVRLGKPLRWPLGVEAERLIGCRCGAATRRGKYLWLPLERPDDHESGGLLLHLGMSGSLGFHAQPGPPGAHDHFDLVTDRGTLRLTDPRRFGAVLWSASLGEGQAGRLLGSLGQEPFDTTLTPEFLRAQLGKRRADIKSVLLAGDVVVGAGNIYACEALFEAGIDPRTPAHRIGLVRATRLLDALRQVLGRAMAAGGSTLKDFRDGHGMSGAYQDEAAVYGRAGAPCRRCGHPVRRFLQGQRATYHCPRCQRRCRPIPSGL